MTKQKQQLETRIDNGKKVHHDDAEDDGDEFQTREGLIGEIDEEDASVDVWMESTEGNLHLVQRIQNEGMVNVLGLNSLDEVLTEDYTKIK